MKRFLLFNFNLKQFTILFIAFIISTIVGTLSHEYGHYAVAKYLGYQSEVSYSYTVWEDKNTSAFTDSVYEKYYKEIQAGTDFPRKAAFEKINNKQIKDDVWITWGGPLQTMLTGTLGLGLILFQKKKIITTQLVNVYQWGCIFIALFWLRPLANLFTWIAGYFINGKLSTHGDEIGLALHYKIPLGSIAILFAIIGAAVLGYIMLKIIPIKLRFTFLLAGLVGGIAGYVFWLELVGPILMP